MIIQKEGILLEDLYNIDESGFRISIRKDQLIITKRRRAYYFGILINRELATIVKAIRASREVIPPFNTWQSGIN